MTDKELIKQEIEKEIGNIKRYIYNSFLAGHSKRDMTVVYETLNKLLRFIDSLPEEPASEDLEEEITKCYKRRIDLMMTRSQFGELIHRFTEWQKQKDFEELLKSDMTQFKECYEKGRFDMREEMMKDAVEGQIYREYIGEDGISVAFGLEAYLNEHNTKHNNLHHGDKVKIVIVKTE